MTDFIGAYTDLIRMIKSKSSSQLCFMLTLLTPGDHRITIDTIKHHLKLRDPIAYALWQEHDPDGDGSKFFQ